MKDKITNFFRRILFFLKNLFIFAILMICGGIALDLVFFTIKCIIDALLSNS